MLKLWRRWHAWRDLAGGSQLICGIFQGGGVPVDPVYKAISSLGMASALPLNPAVSRREAMQELSEQSGLKSVDTRVIRIPVVYSNFDDFWDSNTVPIGPQGQINRKHVDKRERATPHAPARAPAYHFGWTYCLRVIGKRGEGPRAGMRPSWSAIGTKRTCRVALHMSAFGSKADITSASQNVR